MSELSDSGAFTGLISHHQVSADVVKEVSIHSRPYPWPYPGPYLRKRLGPLRQALSVIALFIALFTGTGLAQGALAATGVSVPADLSYSVWMDDRPLGTHDYRFSIPDTAANRTDSPRSASSDNSMLQVDSKARFNVKVLFVNVFNYDHHARELWNGRCLYSVNSETTTNGEEEVLDLQIDAGQCAGTYAYWDKSRLQRTKLTNAQTGEREAATWSVLESQPLPAPNRKARIANPPANISHYKLTTPSASFLLWYDEHGRSLAMQTSNDGRTITYINKELRD